MIQLILHHDSVASFEQAVDLLAEAIGQRFSFEVSTENIKSSVLERETIASTTVGNGVSIPHARIPGFEDLVVRVLVLKTPLEHNNASLQMLAMVLTSESASQLYLNTVASVAKIAEDPSFFRLSWLHREAKSSSRSSTTQDCLSPPSLQSPRLCRPK